MLLVSEERNKVKNKLNIHLESLRNVCEIHSLCMYTMPNTAPQVSAHTKAMLYTCACMNCALESSWLV